jgi:hypothetical protein
VDERLDRVQTEETTFKDMFSQPVRVSSKQELPFSYVVAVLIILWPIMQVLSRSWSPP